jgi:hypothetical protein
MESEPSLKAEAEDLSTPVNGVAVVEVIEDWEKRMKIHNYDADKLLMVETTSIRREQIKHQLLELARATIARRGEMPVFK